MVIIKKNDIIIKFLLTLKFSIFPNNLSFKFPDVEFFELFLEFEEFPALLLFLLLDNLWENSYIVNMRNRNNYTCTICGEFTSYDEWAKPNVSCINCGSEE